MASTRTATRSDTGLASELRLAVMRLRRRLAYERHPDNPLGLGAMAVLGALLRRGDLTVGELAAHERVQPPSMTRTVGGLVEGGYAERRANPDDGRQVVVSITDAGRELVLADRARRDGWLARQLTGLSREERDLLRRAAPLLQRLAQSD
ncbi:MarR family transcriptional regulator [Nocardioides sp. TF02-7]|uniref:MarR family winged helix-turn-helix transcriptional regulator n=1 Tax=Nocardioides sp. TF02-7 TaxID=2917724 RepID=UPI001F065E44|nr:MarR family transcriptional regulator [Nocardioides sp. TF02-7]UMG91372.1 MarR family transcriptional regulator [Nocardioides sp. TF02-7]